MTDVLLDRARQELEQRCMDDPVLGGMCCSVKDNRLVVTQIQEYDMGSVYAPQHEQVMGRVRTYMTNRPVLHFRVQDMYEGNESYWPGSDLYMVALIEYGNLKLHPDN